MDGELPCASQEGKDIFACYVDGEPYVAAVTFKPGGVYKVHMTYNDISGQIDIAGNRDTENDQNEFISFRIFATNGAGTYPMTAYTPSDDTGYLNIHTAKEYFHDSTNVGSVNVTKIDSDIRFISGTFEMLLINSAYYPDSTMSITDGRFDVRY